MKRWLIGLVLALTVFAVILTIGKTVFDVDARVFAAWCAAIAFCLTNPHLVIFNGEIRP